MYSMKSVPVDSAPFAAVLHENSSSPAGHQPEELRLTRSPAPTARQQESRRSSSTKSTGELRRRHASRDRLGNSEYVRVSSYEVSPSMSEERLRVQAWKICHDYLGGAWKTIGPNEMRWRPISGGLSNYLYYCGLPEDSAHSARSCPRTPPATDLKPDGDKAGGLVMDCDNHGSTGRTEYQNMARSSSFLGLTTVPREVLIRIYGQVQAVEQVDIQTIVADSVIFAVLSERRLGPKLYGVFPGGRLEEYIPSPCLLTSELSDPDVSGHIAEQMAAMHLLRLPLSKEPTWIWETMHKWSFAIRHDVLTRASCPPSQAFPDAPQEDHFRFFKAAFDLEVEINWLKSLTDAVHSPVVFGHNDLQEGNILIERRPGDGAVSRLTFIDFEYCSYNYRGFDVANHFCEWMYDYTLEEYPYFTSTPSDFPSADSQVRFLKQYLRAKKREERSHAEWVHGGGTASGEDGTTNARRAGSELNEPSRRAPALEEIDEAELDSFLVEVEVFQLVVHLFWSMWGCINAVTSNIPFGFWEYAVCRAKAYLERKAAVKRKIACGELPSLLSALARRAIGDHDHFSTTSPPTETPIAE